MFVVRLETKAREIELAMWRRRATYDPMKAAAEGRKKQEEAKKSTQKASKYGDRYVHHTIFRLHSIYYCQYPPKLRSENITFHKRHTLN